MSELMTPQSPTSTTTASTTTASTTTAAATTASWTATNVVPTLDAPSRAELARRDRPQWLSSYRLAQVGSDLLVMAVAAALGLFVVAPEAAQGSSLLVTTTIALPFLWPFCLATFGAYARSQLGVGSEEFRRVALAGLLALGVVGFASFAAHLNLSRSLVISVVPLATALTLATRYALRKRLHRARYQGRCLQVAVAVGRETAVLDLVAQLRDERYTGMRIAAACIPARDSGDRLRAAGVPVAGSLDDVPSVIERYGAQAVAVTSTTETGGLYLRRLSWQLEGSGVDLLVAPGLVEVAGPRLHIRPYIGLPLLHLEEPEFTGRRKVIKGVVDRVLACFGILVAAPIMAAIALGIWMDDGGPVMFKQERVGRDGTPFTVFKFRTMRVGADKQHGEMIAASGSDPRLAKSANDSRITKIGKTLRRLSVDELPQLFNVLNGTMSLVGPRPPLPTEVAEYDHSYSRRLLVKPGLTGLWQISGRSDLSIEESVRLDLRYVENWSMSLDVLILWKTIGTVLRPNGAY